MKVQIRKSCFETNSSSMHAIVITNNKPNKDYIEYCSLNFKVGEFGWNHIRYYDPDFKASYLWTIIINSFIKNVYTGKKKKYSWSDEEYDEYYLEFDKENPEYQKIKNDIKEKLTSIGIDVNDEWKVSFQEEFEKTDYGSIETGYVDHDPGLGFVKEILYGPNDRFIRFLFNHDSMIETWNDNEWEINKEVKKAIHKKYFDEKKQEYKDGYWEAEEWAHFMIPNESKIEWKYLKSN